MRPERVKREQTYFDQVAEKEGYSWWGAGTPAGLLRTERRAGLVREALGPDPDKRVLEVGCGSGEITPHLAGHFKFIIGIDVSLGLLKRYRDRLAGRRVVSVLADCERLPFRDGTFDAVCGNNILHHLELDTILPVCARQLKPGGRLAFAEPNLLNPQTWVENKIAFVRQFRPYSPDEMPFTRWHIVQKLNQHGFRDASVKLFDFLHPSTPPALIGAVAAFGRLLERLPLAREIAGSMIISAVKV